MSVADFRGTGTALGDSIAGATCARLSFGLEGGTEGVASDTRGCRFAAACTLRTTGRADDVASGGTDSRAIRSCPCSTTRDGASDLGAANGARDWGVGAVATASVRGRRALAIGSAVDALDLATASVCDARDDPPRSGSRAAPPRGRPPGPGSLGGAEPALAATSSADATAAGIGIGTVSVAATSAGFGAEAGSAVCRMARCCVGHASTPRETNRNATLTPAWRHRERPSMRASSPRSRRQSR